MAQGWDINATADTITFYEPPANGVDIDVIEYAQGTYNATDVWAFGAWSEEFGYPAEVEFFSDRLIFAGTVSDPQTMWFSQTGDYTNFGKSTPIVDSDAIAATINSRQINEVNDLVGLDSLMILTRGTEWRLDTGGSSIVAPDTVGFKPQSYNGSGTVPAIVIDNTALYIQGRGQSVRELSADDSYTGQYNGRDITAFSSHLLEGHTIVEWAYQQYPFSIVWAVRDDGKLLCLTYMKEHDVIGWTLCETEGLVESVCVIPEGGEDAVYVVVSREAPAIEPSSFRAVERLSTRLISDIRFATFADSFVTHDFRVTSSGVSCDVPLSDAGDTGTITTTVPQFASSDVGDYIVVHYDAGANGGFGVRLRITQFNSATSVDVELETPNTISNGIIGTSDWGFARREIDRPDNLAGSTAVMLVDGGVQGPVVLNSSTVTLDPPGVVVCIGLPYQSDLETLEINFAGAETLFTKNKLIKELGIILQESRSVRMGPDFDHLDEVDARQSTSYGNPDMLDGVYELPIRSGWAERGRVCIRQSDPLPISILGLVPNVKEGK